MQHVMVSFMILVLSLAAAGVATAQAAEPPGAGTFGPAGSLAEPRLLHTATALPDGAVIVVGGLWNYPASAELWDPASGRFSPAGSLAEPRGIHTATPLPDGRVLVVGGMDGDGVLASAEVWDPASGTFGPAGSFAEARAWHTATLLRDGRVLVVGGASAELSDVDGFVASSEVWDPMTGTFSPAGPLAEARGAYHTATLLRDGRVLVVGGMGGEAAAEVWDPATGTFEPAGALAEARSGHTATLLSDGRILVVGGGGIDGFLASAELWDPAAASFEPAGSLAEPRGMHTATLLRDGRVLVVGGEGDGEWDDGGAPLLASAEVWDPAVGTFGPAGSLAEARYGHTATLLSDDRVLVVGGWHGEGITASAEAWRPTPAPVADAAVFVDALCTAVDESWTAVGNPDTGETSTLSRRLEDAIARGDTALVDTTTEAMLGHLQAARSAAARAAGYPPAAVGMSAFDDFVVFIAESIAAERDAAPDGLEAARVAANRQSERAYESWRAWINESGPVWSEVAGDMPVPCPSPRS